MDSSIQPLQLSGLATGMDTSSIVQQLMAVERRPVNLMQQAQAKVQSTLDHYRTLNTKLLALQNAAQALTGVTFATSPLAAKKATSGNNAIFTATADSTAAAASYTINVTALASNQKLTYAPTDFNAAHGAGTIAISDGTTTANITVNAGDSIDTIASNINSNANSGMSAAVVTDSSGNKSLILSGKNTGVNYTFTDSSGALTGGTNVAATQASLTVDGIGPITSNNNTFTNAVPGVTINAVSTGSTSVTITQDTQATVDKVKDFVAKYNDVLKQIQDDTKYDSTKKTGGPLLGDSFVENLTTQLNQTLTGAFQMNVNGVYGTDPVYNSYNSVGISVQRDGTLSLDETKLTKALTTDPQKVYQLFAQEDGATQTVGGTTVKQNTNNDGIANRISAFVDSMIATSSMYNFPDPNGVRYKGGILNAMDSLQASIDDYTKRIGDYNQRLDLRQQALQARFTAMETAVSTLRNQGNYLSGQFAKMGG